VGVEENKRDFRESNMKKKLGGVYIKES
jgi:hypothetical protein